MELKERDPDEQPRSDANLIVASIVLVLVLFWLFFSYLNTVLKNPNRNPVSKSTDKYNQIVLRRNSSGRYRTIGEINNKTVTFVIGTLTTSVAVPSRLAKKLGLEREAPEKLRDMHKGITLAWRTRIKSLSLGNLKFRNVEGVIFDSKKSGEIMLGMSVLKKLEIIQRGRTMILRQYKK